MRYILSIDQGTTGTRAIIYNEALEPCWSSYMEHRQICPHPGWTEHDPLEIYENTCSVIRAALLQANKAGVALQSVCCAGISNQGETVMAWDRESGKPLSNAVVWHCTRSAEIAERLKKRPGFSGLVRAHTGLMVDAYFSATKILWLRENRKSVQRALAEGRALFGTLDSWLIWKLTGRRSYVTDVATASRTMLMNLHTRQWDKEILSALDISEETLPRILPNCAEFGDARIELPGGAFFNVPITGAIVDQQGALFGQCCFERGMVKATYGTGCFVLLNTGEKPVLSQNGLLTSVGWSVGKHSCYVLDGAIYMAGAAMQWLRDKLALIDDFKQLDEYALSLPDNGGVYFVTAFSGLSAPTWAANARGTLVGLTTGTGKEHIVRAALESVAFQVSQLITCFEQDTGLPVKRLRADGGLSQSRFLMQLQADLLNRPISVMQSAEATAKGTAMLAGLQFGLFSSLEQLAENQEQPLPYTPSISQTQRDSLLLNWNRALSCALAWIK